MVPLLERDHGAGHSAPDLRDHLKRSVVDRLVVPLKCLVCPVSRGLHGLFSAEHAGRFRGGGVPGTGIEWDPIEADLFGGALPTPGKIFAAEY